MLKIICKYNINLKLEKKIYKKSFLREIVVTILNLCERKSLVKFFFFFLIIFYINHIIFTPNGVGYSTFCAHLKKVNVFKETRKVMIKLSFKRWRAIETSLLFIATLLTLNLYKVKKKTLNVIEIL